MDEAHDTYRAGCQAATWRNDRCGRDDTYDVDLGNATHARVCTLHLEVYESHREQYGIEAAAHRILTGTISRQAREARLLGTL